MRHVTSQAEAKQDVATMIALQPALKFNGGGDSCILAMTLQERMLLPEHIMM